MTAFRGVCVDPGWGPGGLGSPDPALLARLGIFRVRLISRKNIEWYVDQCWAQGILVRAVVTDGYYCPADEYFVLNEPNLNYVSAQSFAEQLQIHRHTYPDKVLIAGAVGDAPAIGIDGAAYMNQVINYGGLVGYQGVAIHYPGSAARMAAFKKTVASRPIHVSEYNVESDKLPDYLTKVLGPYATTADWFCVNNGMWDPSWTRDMGLFNSDGSTTTVLRHWLGLA